MVLRPSLKRVVPGSVPPWRALCAASARALKAFFSVTHVLAAGRGPHRRSQAGGQPPGGALLLPLGPCGWSRLGSSRACFFRGLDPGCRAMFLVAAPCFSNSGGRLAEHFRHRNALGFARRRTSKLVGRAATQLIKRELEIIAKPLRLLHESLLSGRSFLAPLRAETRNYSLLLQPIACRLSIRLGRCSPIFAICHLLRWSLCARALLPLCFRCVRFVNLRWCGSWPLVAGLGGWD